MLCSTPHSHCVVFLKSTFDHPIEGHSAFIQDEGYVNPLEVSLGCSLRRPRPITIGNPASYI
jgi:hypothetical protein